MWILRVLQLQLRDGNGGDGWIVASTTLVRLSTRIARFFGSLLRFSQLGTYPYTLHLSPYRLLLLQTISLPNRRIAVHPSTRLLHLQLLLSQTSQTLPFLSHHRFLQLLTTRSHFQPRPPASPFGLRHLRSQRILPLRRLSLLSIRSSYHSGFQRKGRLLGDRKGSLQQVEHEGEEAAQVRRSISLSLSFDASRLPALDFL